MQSKAKTVQEYIDSLPEERKAAIQKLRSVILDNLPEGFEETMSYGMLGYVVPLSLYPDGYHTGKDIPLPFISIASQKNFIGFYHMGIYADEKLLAWFRDEYSKHISTKIDMGKSCVRFKKPEKIPFDLIGELVAKITPQQWIDIYEKNYKK